MAAKDSMNDFDLILFGPSGNAVAVALLQARGVTDAHDLWRCVVRWRESDNAAAYRTEWQTLARTGLSVAEIRRRLRDAFVFNVEGLP